MTITLNHKRPSGNRNPRNAYVVLLKVMHGDADSYSNIKFGPFDATTLKGKYEYEGDIESVVRVIEAAKNLNDTDWNHAAERYPELENWSMVSEEWPTDNPHFDWPAMYDEHKIRFYDEHGVEYEVEYQLA